MRRDAERLPLHGFGALDYRDDLGGDAPVEADVLLERVHHPPAQRFSLGRTLRSRPLEWERGRGGTEHVACWYVAGDPRAGDSFDQDTRGAGGKSGDLDDPPDDAGAVQVGSGGLLLLAVALRHQENDLVLGKGRLDGGKRGRPPDEERDYYVGKNDNIPKREDRNPVRRRDGLIVPLEGLRQR